MRNASHLNISKPVQVYLLASRLLRRLNRLPKPLSTITGTVEVFWQAVWLGLLNSTRLNEVTWAYYMGNSGFQAEEFNIDQGLWHWEANAIKIHFQGEKRVLVAGAGGGREVIALARCGYEVTAFDFSSYLTAACRRNLEKAGYTADVLDAPPDGVPRGLDCYDALLIGRGFYHHIPTRSRRIAFLKACQDSLKPGAPIILSDFFTRPVDSRFYLRIRAIANLLRRLGRHSEQIELGDHLTNCMQHAFTQEEIEQELQSAGIKSDVFAVSPYSVDSHLAHVLGRTS